jgi:hypothetical protein
MFKDLTSAFCDILHLSGLTDTLPDSQPRIVAHFQLLAATLVKLL